MEHLDAAALETASLDPIPEPSKLTCPAAVRELLPPSAGLGARPMTLGPSHATSPGACSENPPARVFDGDHHKFQRAIDQVCMLFLMWPSLYPQAQTTVGLITSLLSGEATDWATPIME